jgi:hypothetical protein
MQRTPELPLLQEILCVRPMTENAVPAALRRMRYPKEEMTVHGFRSMASTLLHEQAGTIKLLSASLPMLSAMQ